MAQRASKIHACVFVNTSYTKAFIFNTSGVPVDVDTAQLTQREASAYIAMQDAFNMAAGQYGAFQYENNVCPWDWGTNNSVVAEHGLFVLPAAVITAEYPDGSKKQYVLGKDFVDKLTGGIWTAKRLFPYIKTLLLNSQPSESQQTVLCKLLPPLCSLGGWVWFGLAIGATVKASNSTGKISQGVWGAGASLLWWEWYQRGGLDQLKQTAGIGKFYDDVTIRPGSRVDSYWKGLKPSPSKYGVEQIKSPTEAVFDRQIQEITKEIADTDKLMKQKIKSLTDQKASATDITRIIQPIEAVLRTKRVELQRLLLKKTEVVEYSKNEATLFGHKRKRIGAIFL